jgi:hypothetical protein
LMRDSNSAVGLASRPCGVPRSDPEGAAVGAVANEALSLSDLGCQAAGVGDAQLLRQLLGASQGLACRLGSPCPEQDLGLSTQEGRVFRDQRSDAGRSLFDQLQSLVGLSFCDAEECEDSEDSKRKLAAWSSMRLVIQLPRAGYARAWVAAWSPTHTGPFSCPL